MSLTVHAFAYHADGSTRFLDDEPSRDLAGGERWRESLWGHPAVQALGAIVLPTLKDSNISAEHEELLQLEAELMLLLKHLPAIAIATGHDEESIEVRSRNILRAIERAREVGGGVVVW